MADYCTTDDVQKRLRDFNVDDIDAATTIAPRITDASNTIDMKLSHYYTVPFSIPRTDIVHTICVELASAMVLETVYQDKSDEESSVATKVWDRGMEMLEHIRCNRGDVPGETRLA